MKQKKLEDVLSAALKINLMKKIFVILTLLCYGAIHAQPQKINYQAVADSGSGVNLNCCKELGIVGNHAREGS